MPALLRRPLRPPRLTFLAALLHAAIASTLPPAVGAHDDSHSNHHRGPNLDLVEKPFGQTGDPTKVTRTIRVTGNDKMRFSPSRIAVRQGDTVRFVFINAGKLKHEAMLGTLDELKQHAEWMKKFPGMEHDEPFMVHVEPDHSGEMVWQFTQAGEFHFACLIPGHFEAGMVGLIVVEPRSR